MTNRRTVMISLGLLASTSGCSGIFGLEESMDKVAEETAKGMFTTSTEFSEIESKFHDYQQSRPEPYPDMEFGYGRIEISDVNSSIVKNVVAHSEDERGDTLVIEPGDVAPDDLAKVLRNTWKSGNGTKITTTIDGREVEFSGGSGTKYTYLVGTVGSTKSGYVAISRGVDLDSAVSLAKDFSLLESQ